MARSKKVLHDNIAGDADANAAVDRYAETIATARKNNNGNAAKLSVQKKLRSVDPDTDEPIYDIILTEE